jgi:hypothetical protein
VRQNSPIFHAALKANTQAAYDAVGGTSSAADLLGVTIAPLSKYASPADQWKDNFIRVDLAVELDRRSAHPFILTTMARELSYGLVSIDVREGMEVKLCPLSLLKLDRVLDDVVDEVGKAFEDGHVDALERKEIRKRIASAKQALSKLDAMMIGGDE